MTRHVATPRIFGLSRLGALLGGLALSLPAAALTLVVATVNNGHMLQMASLSPEFERAHPNIKLRWITLSEAQLRKAVSSDIATQGRQFDVVTVGMYEVPIWARQGWLTPIHTTPEMEPQDLLPNIREGLSHQGRLYGAPIYGESSMLFYRKDLFARAGLSMPAQPTWSDIAHFAARLHAPKDKVYGICLRAKAGWGENITLLTTIANTHGAQWFDMQWRPQLQTPAWHEALSLYVNLLRRYGPPDAVQRGYNENLALFLAGRCAIWVDATVAAGFLADPGQNPHAQQVGFAPAPVGTTPKGARWLWAWALAIPSDIDAAHTEAAQTFVAWATSRTYIEQVAALRGWGLVPSGTRVSTYANPRFQRAAPWASHELAAIRGADPRNATLPPSPYLGVQFATIPEFAAIGDEVGQRIAEAVAGHLSVDEALALSQRAAQRRMLSATPP
ncbi:sugar ABC transporter substrate-binding protein [Hylemonella gracilis]|uniref:Sugar ABC transporter substrate-binding protein n=1 Tax=Hylemonella gracilis TaxID=80880 RepID=A0A4P6UHZ9_9BURK|nr:sugar ABC transporter substrate-binding protein [Hylemonella gracilis]QBK04692.1 sugar ABC transporter substrate-binding protein [Hylemonella gracilis]